MLAAVANCGRSWRWCGRERLVLAFKPRHGSHAMSFWDHAAWAEKNRASFGDHVAFWDHVAWAEKNHGLLLLFSAIRYPRLGRGGEGRTVCLGVF